MSEKPLGDMSDVELHEYLQSELRAVLQPLAQTAFLTPETQQRLEETIHDTLLRLLAGQGLEPDQFKVRAEPDPDDPTKINLTFRGPPWLLVGLGVAPAIGPTEPDLSDAAYRRGECQRYVTTLSVKETHSRNPKCQMHLVPMPDGNWMCLDCGQTILQRRILLTGQMLGTLGLHGFGEEPILRPGAIIQED